MDPGRTKAGATTAPTSSSSFGSASPVLGFGLFQRGGHLGHGHQRARDLIEHLERGKRTRKVGRSSGRRGLSRLGFGLHGLAHRRPPHLGSSERIGCTAFLRRRWRPPGSSALVQSAERRTIFSGGLGSGSGKGRRPVRRGEIQAAPAREATAGDRARSDLADRREEAGQERNEPREEVRDEHDAEQDQHDAACHLDRPELAADLP